MMYEDVEEKQVTTKTTEDIPTGRKSVVIAYLLWLLGGMWGLHHLYLRRDGHAFVWCCSLGGYFGLGWCKDTMEIPKYVQHFNDDGKFVKQLQVNDLPPFSLKRIYGQYLVGALFGYACMLGIPNAVRMYLDWCIPLSISLGVWLGGNIGRECGVWWHTGFATMLIYRFLGNHCGLLMISLLSACVFTLFSRQWRRHPQHCWNFPLRFIRFIAAYCIYLGLWLSYLYFNACFEIWPDQCVPVYAIFIQFVQSKWWADFKLALTEMWAYGNAHGWIKVFEYDEGFGVDK